MACSRPRLTGLLVACARWAPLCGLLVLAGCASTLDVRTLATARADQSAYELTGRDLAALLREARLLCPQGGEILRQTAHDQRLEAVDSRLERWTHFSSQWIAPPERRAQLVVACHPVADRQLLAAAMAAMPAASAVPAEHAASAPGAIAGASPTDPPKVPIGPLSVEW